MFLADLADEFWLDLALAAVAGTSEAQSFHFLHYFTIESDEWFSPFSLSEPLVERRAFERRAKRKIPKMNAGASEIQGKKIEWGADSEPCKNEGVPSSTLQRPELYMDMSTPQGPLQHIDVSPRHRGLSCTRTCLDKRKLFCSWTFLQYRDLRCTLTYLYTEPIKYSA